MSAGQVKRRWRFYSTPAGRRPVDVFIDALPELDAAEVHAAMKEVRDKGTRLARHLRGDIYEVRAEGPNDSYRILFATEGKKSRILLAVHAILKHGQKAPNHAIDVAERRLREWRDRGRRRRQTAQPRRPRP